MLDLSPENKILRQQTENLKKEFAELYEKWNFMLTYEEAGLTSLYLEYIGGWQFKLFRVQTELAQLKQKIQLAQAYFNRNVLPDWSKIESTLAKEFEAYQQKIAEDAQKLASAHAYLKEGFLNGHDTAQLKEVYRLLVKRLHPDLNPDITDYERELFLRVQAAYQLCDLQALNEMLLMLNKDVPVVMLPLPDLRTLVNQLTEKVKALQQKTEALNLKFPYIYRAKLQDELWVAAEQESIRKQIEIIETEIKEKTEYLLLLASWKPESLH
jgi:hypothetical protein